MKRIAVVYDDHPEHPRIKTTGFFIEKAFKQLKKDGYLHYDRFYSNHQNILKDNYYKYDFALYIDDDRKYQINMDKRLPIAYWCFDIHIRITKLIYAYLYKYFIGLSPSNAPIGREF